MYKGIIFLIFLFTVSLTANAIDLSRTIMWDDDSSYAVSETAPDYFDIRCGVDMQGVDLIPIRATDPNTATCVVSYDPASAHTLFVDARACRDIASDPSLKCSQWASIQVGLPQGLKPPINIRIDLSGTLSLSADDLRQLIGGTQ